MHVNRRYHICSSQRTVSSLLVAARLWSYVRSSWRAPAFLACLLFLLTFLSPVGPRLSLAALPPPRATMNVSGGISPGFPNHTFENPALLFTWTKELQVSGSGWAAQVSLVGETAGPVVIFLRGPLNSPGVDPSERNIGVLASDFGAISGSVTIPYDEGVVGPDVEIPRPGRYEVIGRQFIETASGFRVLTARAQERINLCPATSLIEDSSAAKDPNRNNSIIAWGLERGGRRGTMKDDLSPEGVDPHWISVWDEHPVEVYGTAAPTGFDGDNQPAFITHTDWPNDHYAHDVNVHLVPDPEYKWVLGTANYYANEKNPEERENGRIEVEWEALNDRSPERYEQGNIGVPLFAVPTAGDRVYVLGRWILDVGHPTTGDRTEIHPPRLIATMRKYPDAIPLGGQLTRASRVDIYVSGHGGGANQFFDKLSADLNNGGRGGGRIRDMLNPSQEALYRAPSVIGSATLFPPSASLTIINGHGPSGIDDWEHRAAEEQPINDMDYEFDVPLPPRPPGATQPVVIERTPRPPQDSSNVEPEFTFIEADPQTGLPMEHVRLPYKGPDKHGIFARSFLFSWKAVSPSGQRFRVELEDITIKDDSESIFEGDGEFKLWTDIAGHWFFLTGLNGNLLDASGGDRFAFKNVDADVFLDENEPFPYVLTQGYEADAFEDHFGGLGEPPISGAVALAVVTLGNDNDNVGGALFPAASGNGFPFVGPGGAQVLRRDIRVPASPLDGTSYFDMHFRVISLPPNKPRIDVHGVSRDAPLEFGTVFQGFPHDRQISISNIGEVPLTVTAITISGDGFSLPNGAPPFTLNSNESRDVNVRFSATNFLTNQTGAINIQSTDQLEPMLTFGLHARSVGVPSGVKTFVATVLKKLRLGSPDVLAEISFTNNNPATATNARLTSAILEFGEEVSTEADQPLPNLGTMAPGEFKSTIVRFSGPVAQAGTDALLLVRGVDDSGTFGGSFRVTIPMAPVDEGDFPGFVSRVRAKSQNRSLTGSVWRPSQYFKWSGKKSYSAFASKSK
jgi:hypothetical protein